MTEYVNKYKGVLKEGDKYWNPENLENQLAVKLGLNMNLLVIIKHFTGVLWDITGIKSVKCSSQVVYIKI